MARTTTWLVFACLAMVSSAGCGKQRIVHTLATGPSPVIAEPPAPPPPPPVVAPSPQTVESDADIFARKTLEQLNAEQPLKHVFFDVDSTTLHTASRSTLQANAEWLRRWVQTRIVIEGHCDERGSAEYNLALGDQRAAAIKTYLIDIGVQPERLITVSKGKEEPTCREQDERCWLQNRRGHFLIVAK